jgi:hypothetical protein
VLVPAVGTAVSGAAVTGVSVVPGAAVDGVSVLSGTASVGAGVTGVSAVTTSSCDHTGTHQKQSTFSTIAQTRTFSACRSHVHADYTNTSQHMQQYRSDATAVCVKGNSYSSSKQ